MNDTGVEASFSSVGGRGTANGIPGWGLSIKNVVVQFDEFGEPVGDDSSRMSSQLGHLVAERVPFNYLDWDKVPDNIKDGIWNDVEVVIYTLAVFFKLLNIKC